MRSRGVAHTNGHVTSAPAEPAMPQHLAAMTTYDEVERHIAQLRQRIAALPPAASSSAAVSAERALLTAELAFARSRLSVIQSNGRYIALLACAAMLVLFLVLLLLGWQSPLVSLHGLVNSANRDRMARMGLTEDALLESGRDDASYVQAFDWWSWLLRYGSNTDKQQPNT